MTERKEINRKRIIAVSVVILILFCDQLIKIFVKTGMTLHSTIPICGTWVQLYFTENKGMAFGMDFIGTFVLCGVRIIAVSLLAFGLSKMIVRRAPTGFIVCLALVTAGAAGNIFDNLFYGLIFTESTEYSIASFVSFGEGYGSFCGGKVVDMFYFPIIDTVLPEWVPFRGGQRFIFFAPIFNLADSAITCGGFALVVFYRKTFSVYFDKLFTKRSKEEDNESDNKNV